jgi:hypothetical protein
MIRTTKKILFYILTTYFYDMFYNYKRSHYLSSEFLIISILYGNVNIALS